MTRLRVLGLVGLLALGVAAYAAATPAGPADVDSGKTIAIRDDCDPTDPAWNPTGGCTLKKGDVKFAEFAGEFDSPLAAAVIGHQAWRNDPPYLEIKAGQDVRVKNVGGRVHTLTEVAAFGGGKVLGSAAQRGVGHGPGVPRLGRPCAGRSDQVGRSLAR